MPKIIQIIGVPDSTFAPGETTALIYGLGEDSLVYYWSQDHEWKLF